MYLTWAMLLFSDPPARRMSDEYGPGGLECSTGPTISGTDHEVVPRLPGADAPVLGDKAQAREEEAKSAALGPRTRWTTSCSAWNRAAQANSSRHGAT